MTCKCGNKTNNKNGVCNSCRAKINLLNQIREIIEPKKEEAKTAIRRIKKRKKYYSQKKHSTICWNCKKACGGCSWSRDFVPVDGWSAIPTKVLVLNTKSNGARERIFTDSFDVYYCPEFEILEMLK